MTICIYNCFTLQILFYHVFRSILEKISVFGISIFLSKNYPCPPKTNVVARICKIFKSNLFCCMHRMSGFHRKHYCRHYLCMFLNAGFQNLGKLNTGFDLILFGDSGISGLFCFNCIIRSSMHKSVSFSRFGFP